MSRIAYTPLNAPDTVAKPGRVIVCKNGECRLSLVFGIYFDGTNNNRDEDMQTLSHSNIARLYNAAYKEPVNGLSAIYIPGVGTPFPQIGEVAPHDNGASRGSMGAERIRYAVLSIVNQISWVATKRLIVQEGEIHQAVRSDGNYASWNHRLTALITQMRQRQQGPQIQEIVIDIFGFSRGAAAARSFVNQLLKHFSPSGKFFCSIPLRLRFMGLFDTVASVGLADSVPVPGAEGHQDWGDQDLLVIPPQVEECVHFVAGHEGRKSFPVDLVLRKDGSYPSNCIEVVYPGMHSDVGGGYGPGDQGKARHDQSQLLSQIALNDMYDRALSAGVPLRKREKLAETTLLASQFAIDATLRSYYTSYLKFVRSNCEGKPAIRQYETHLRQYLHWRREVLPEARFLEQTCMSDGIAAQDRINLLESNRQFRRYVQQLERDETALATYEAVHGKYYMDPRIPPPPVDREAIGYYRKYWKDRFLSDTAVHTFFETYVHDSRAGFAIVDPVTQHDHRRIHKRLKQRDQNYQAQLKRHGAQVSGGYALAKVGVLPLDPLTTRERRNLAIYDKTPGAPDTDKPYVEVPLYDDRHPGSSDDGDVGLVDVVAAVDRRREGRWSYLHPRQHFAYSRLKF